jgi:hypothetical protein
MTQRGVLQWRGLEGGYWALVTSNEEYVLKGEIPKQLSGRDVVVEGELDESFNFFMAGPSLKVKSVRAG